MKLLTAMVLADGPWRQDSGAEHTAP